MIIIEREISSLIYKEFQKKVKEFIKCVYSQIMSFHILMVDVKMLVEIVEKESALVTLTFDLMTPKSIEIIWGQ